MIYLDFLLSWSPIVFEEGILLCGWRIGPLQRYVLLVLRYAHMENADSRLGHGFDGVYLMKW